MKLINHICGHLPTARPHNQTSDFLYEALPYFGGISVFEIRGKLQRINCEKVGQSAVAFEIQNSSLGCQNC